MNTQTDSRPAARPIPLALEYRPKALPVVSESKKRWPQDATRPAYTEPSADIAYGCVEWFCYDKHENPLKGCSGKTR